MSATLAFQPRLTQITWLGVGYLLRRGLVFYNITEYLFKSVVTFTSTNTLRGLKQLMFLKGSRFFYLWDLN